MEKDNVFMIEEITGIPIIAKVAKMIMDLKMEKEVIAKTIYIKICFCRCMKWEVKK